MHSSILTLSYVHLQQSTEAADKRASSVSQQLLQLQVRTHLPSCIECSA
jgi:hypothetical protein